MVAPIYRSAKKDDGEKDGKVIAREKEASEATEKKQVEKTRSEGDKKPDEKEYLGGDKEPGEGSAKREMAAKESEEGDGEGGDADMEAKERAAMHKRHLVEQTDHHNNFRETLKQMQKRHEKEIAEMHKNQAEKMMPADSGAAAGDAGEAAPAAQE